MSRIPPRPGLAEAIAILRSITGTEADVRAVNPDDPQFTVLLHFSRELLKEYGARGWADGPTPLYLLDTLLQLLQDLAGHYAREQRWADAPIAAGATPADCLAWLKFEAGKINKGPLDTAAAMQLKFYQRTLGYLTELEERRAAGGYRSARAERQAQDSARWQWENSPEHDDFMRKQREQRARSSGRPDYTKGEFPYGGAAWKQARDAWEKARDYYRPEHQWAPAEKSNGARSWFEVLGLTPQATKADIKVAYRALAKKHHPDREGGSHEKMQALNAARDEGLAGARN